MKVIAFEPWHAQVMRLQPHQKHIGGVEYLKLLRAHGPALTAVHDGKIIACGGVAVGTLWGYIAEDSKRYFVPLDRIVRRLLLSCELPRVEATVETNFYNGCRWLSLLGFTMKKTLPKYVEGQDHYLYEWVK